jgi:hypothetical protein
MEEAVKDLRPELLPLEVALFAGVNP